MIADLADKDLFTIGLVQQKHSSPIWEAVEKAASEGAQIVCLQELVGQPYFCIEQSAAHFDRALATDGKLLCEAKEIARKLQIVLILPFFEKRAPGIYHNSAACIDVDGTLLGTYRKMHIPDDPYFFEKFYFTPGEAYRVFETSVARVGVLICWDQWYPEAARITSLMGAEILFYPTAIGWLPEEKDSLGELQHDAWQTAQRAHAIASGVYVASVNRVGVESSGDGTIEFFGRSFVSSPFGKVLAEASEGEEEVLVVSCSRRELEHTRQQWPFFRDRRIESYSPITARYLKDS